MNKHVKRELSWIFALGAVALYATKNKKLALLPAGAAAFLLLQKNKSESFSEHSVVITGGSRGLGFALATELVYQDANVTLLARDREELQKAQERLQRIGRGFVHIIECDVTQPDALKEAFVEASEKFGGIDMLINNAGSITVGPWESMEMEDFEAQIKLHAYAPINATRLVLPYLRQTSSGKRIVNICSMGGKVAVPHMLPYDTSKFALAGFSQGVTAELEKEGISVTTIYPALMRTGSPIQAVFKGDHEKEFAWFQLGDVFPFVSTSAYEAAKQIIEAARDRRAELIPAFIGKLRMTVGAFFPELMNLIMAGLNRLMPVGQSTSHKTGAQSRRIFDDSRVTRPFVEWAHMPEQELNQEPKSDARFNMNLH